MRKAFSFAMSYVIPPVLLLALFALLTAPYSTHAVECTARFCPLADVSSSPKLQALYSNDQNLATYINSLFRIAISIGAIIAVGRLAFAGYQYMGGDMWHTKEKAKETIRDVFLGLFLLLSVFLILKQINPNLLNLGVTLPTVTLSPPAAAPASAGTGTRAQSSGPGRLTIGTGACAPNTAAFGNQARQMSCICGAESGGVANRMSNVDKATDGRAISTGLYQINMSANSVYCPGPPASVLDCPSAFSGGPLNSTRRNVTIRDNGLYNDCLAAANTASCSTETARRLLSNGRGLNNWSAWTGGTQSSCIQ